MSKLWHPDAIRAPSEDAGAFTGGGHKIVLHTTEGGTPTSVVATLKANRSAVHFVIGTAGPLYQLIPLNKAGRGLEHPSGPETNRANAIQIEIVGFAKDSQNWSDAFYERIGHLCRWIEKNFNVPHKCGVEFTATASSPAKRLGGQAFFEYAGYIGHEHVPGNSHWDPGRLRINKLLKAAEPGGAGGKGK